MEDGVGAAIGTIFICIICIYNILKTGVGAAVGLLLLLFNIFKYGMCKY